MGSVAGIALVGSPLSPAASNAALMSIPATSFIISNAGGSAAQQKRGGARRGASRGARWGAIGAGGGGEGGAGGDGRYDE